MYRIIFWNIVCILIFHITDYVSFTFFRVLYSLDFILLGPFSAFKRISYLALSCIVLCVSLGLLYCMGFLLDITSESISQMKSTCLFIFCLTPLKQNTEIFFLYQDEIVIRSMAYRWWLNILSMYAFNQTW